MVEPGFNLRQLVSEGALLSLHVIASTLGGDLMVPSLDCTLESPVKPLKIPMPGPTSKDTGLCALGLPQY